MVGVRNRVAVCIVEYRPLFTANPFVENISMGKYYVEDQDFLIMNKYKKYVRVGNQVNLSDFRRMTMEERIAALNAEPLFFSFSLTEDNRLHITVNEEEKQWDTFEETSFDLTLIWPANDGVGIALGLHEPFDLTDGATYRHCMHMRRDNIVHIFQIHWIGDAYTLARRDYTISFFILSIRETTLQSEIVRHTSRRSRGHYTK